jgi:ABC-type transport system substrate-binding protein
VLLEKMPEVSADGLTYTFTLKEGVKFHDNACFPDGKGRLIAPEDFFYSLKRLADPANGLKNWWLLDGVIAGFGTEGYLLCLRRMASLLGGL